MLPGLENYRGKGWLRNSVEGVDGKALRLVFGGVSYMGTVFVDGRKKRYHYDAFTPWDVVVPGLGPNRSVRMNQTRGRVRCEKADDIDF